ncbi:MAG TPA: hypothetical protein VHE80_03230 [Acidimicrobiales bacterium]|nr:hypothetical protein [Acidimicrobiales bacterium]
MSEILERLREECLAYVAENFDSSRAHDERAWNAAIHHVLGGNSFGGAPTRVEELNDDQVERVVQAFNELTLLAAGPQDEPAEPRASPAALDEDTYTWLRLPPASYEDLGQQQALDQFVAEAHRIVSYWLLNAPGGPRNPGDEGALS